ncbi:hypothetical protein GCM10007147_16340 [Nocardiopsis kunsanensis]|uniref:Uncharacterized protein n=1 Tax=Nocardiopsis kunsanensis TaxID=141693 RepID=A0A919CH21_9ACTN|nr:hypothetical protein GCM10007147_16340 [Nocardiopsis kunsanensis]
MAVTANREVRADGLLPPLGPRPGATVVIPVPDASGTGDEGELEHVMGRVRERIGPDGDLDVLLCTTVPSTDPEPPGQRVLTVPGPARLWELARAGLAEAGGDVVLLARPGTVPRRSEVDGHVRAHLAEHAAVAVGRATVESGTGGPRPDRLRDVYPKAPASHPRALLAEVGVADTRAPEELLHRMLQFGAVLVPGPRTELVDPAEKDTGTTVKARTDGPDEPPLPDRDPELEHRVPWHPARRARPARLWEVPFTDVVVDAFHASAEEVRITADSLLNSNDADLVLTLVGPWGARDRATAGTVRLLRELYRYEPRVGFADHTSEPGPEVPFRLWLPAGVELAPDALSTLAAAADERAAGLLTVPCGKRGELRWERTAALARARLTGAGLGGTAPPWNACTAESHSVVEEAPPWPREGDERTRQARRESRALKEDAQRWERRIRALTRGRAARLVLGRGSGPR